MTPGPRKRVAVAERWRSFAAASAVVGRRQASALRSARDRIPKDADGRLRVYRRSAVLFYSSMIRKSGIRFSEKIMLH
jgi:hypothetical protein